MSFKGRLKNNNPTLERSARSQKELRRCSLREKLDRNINLATDLFVMVKT